MNKHPPIKPCPFCGNEGILESIKNISSDYASVYVRCSWCPAKVFGYSFNALSEGEHTEAVSAAVIYWNTRVTK